MNLLGELLLRLFAYILSLCVPVGVKFAKFFNVKPYDTPGYVPRDHCTLTLQTVTA
jgi:hypothetical protein